MCEMSPNNITDARKMAQAHGSRTRQASVDSDVSPMRGTKESFDGKQGMPKNNLARSVRINRAHEEYSGRYPRHASAESDGFAREGRDSSSKMR